MAQLVVGYCYSCYSYCCCYNYCYCCCYCCCYYYCYYNCYYYYYYYNYYYCCWLYICPSPRCHSTSCPPTSVVAPSGRCQ